VCKKGYYIAIISTIQETNDPMTELKIAFDLIGGEPLETFLLVSDIFVPSNCPENDHV
jgi:RAB protein geranylgeranyltransferase component A